MVGKVILNEIWHKSLERYVETKVFRVNGIVEITRITKMGVHYTKLGEKAELMTASCKQFFVPAIYLPYAEEDNQFVELHSYCWEHCQMYIAKQTNGLFIPGLHKSAPLIEIYQDKNGLHHTSRLHQRRADAHFYRAKTPRTFKREYEDFGL